MPNPVTHFEIVGRDPAALQRFYREAFGWELASEGSPYTMVHPAAGAGINGGIGSAPEGGGASRVTVYVEVDDLEAALAAVERLGGRRVMGPAPVPNGPTIALFEDPEGHVIGLAGARSSV
jgi:predicted enzyme related to lactoylglutathione lyase